ncbi:hypothetical protein LT318_00623 [Spiroplasma sp. JKS002670]|nr:hypothetical protein [Spiroplasma sp. JKS002670]
MWRGIESLALLVICCEGKTTHLDEQNYFCQLNKYIKQYQPKFIKFTEIIFIKREINCILNIERTVKFLKRTGIKSKYDKIILWKDNDNQPSIQNENKKIINLENKLFEELKEYLVTDKRTKENFAIWFLPQGWNFEIFYLNHFSMSPKFKNKSNLKELFKEHDHFIKKVFNEENFRNIDTKLKSLDSNISLFDFSDEKER